MSDMSGHLPIIELRGQRVLCEFVCYCAKKYIYIWLNTGVSGNHTIVCPTCAHEHHRYIEKGVITKDRHQKGKSVGETIHPTGAAAQAEPRKHGLIAKIREMEIVGAHK